MGKYRTRLEIIADVLNVVSDGAKKTQIMYGANLSYALLCRYLDAVMALELAREGEDSVYRLTAKGQDFLQAFTDYQERRVAVEERLSDVHHEEVQLIHRFLNQEIRVATDDDT